MSRILLTGATGLVGSQVLKLLRRDPRASKIIVPTRRALPPGACLVNPTGPRLTDMLHALDEPLDAVICCLGTTRQQAGSKNAFVMVDYGLVIDSALTGLRLGAKQMLVVSSMGADARSPFLYNRVKGEMEQTLIAQRWPRLVIVRPSMLLGKRPRQRLNESLLAPFFRLMPGNWRAIEAQEVAQALVWQLFSRGGSSLSVLKGREIRACARRRQRP
ncbi:hypothetical protein TUM12370_05280 [Salmonella enterica subsp. enterica serovar Choleraesuis]|nr:hypothetical protein TUM12370_05280 [Salmonella enterica subsp. enterica serovar Choleraesuis]